MYATHCVLMYVFVHRCALALQLSTLVSMRNAQSIHCVCVWVVKVYVLIPIRKHVFEFSSACLLPIHALYFKRAPVLNRL